MARESVSGPTYKIKIRMRACTNTLSHENVSDFSLG